MGVRREEQSQQVRGRDRQVLGVDRAVCGAHSLCWMQRWNENSGVAPRLEPEHLEGWRSSD